MQTPQRTCVSPPSPDARENGGYEGQRERCEENDLRGYSLCRDQAQARHSATMTASQQGEAHLPASHHAAQTLSRLTSSRAQYVASPHPLHRQVSIPWNT